MSSALVAVPTLPQPLGRAPRGHVPAPRRVALVTLGCKVNSFESEHIAAQLHARGYQRVAANAAADVCIVNTCTVTAEADRQARQLIRRMVRQNPQAWVVVTGCYAQMDAAACAAIAGVDLVVGNSNKLEIPSLLESLTADNSPQVVHAAVDQAVSLPQQLLSGFEGRSRAFVQIQQGCDQACTFCIIHVARGPNRSFAYAAIRRQVERLVLNDYHEIVICGVDIGAYGRDYGADSAAGAAQPTDLAGLLRGLARIDGDFRLRLSSIDPAHITDELLAVLADNPKICRQLHLSMQSGNSLILKRMKRRATRSVLYQRVQALRQALPELVLSADVLVGFPTEQECHFVDTLRAVEQLEIAFPHVFTYSPRAGTPAARIPKQVPLAVRKQRAQRVRQAGQQVWQRLAQRQIGQRLRILLESTKPNAAKPSAAKPSAEVDAPTKLRGRAANYFPVEVVDWPAKSPAKFPLKYPGHGEWLEVEVCGVGPQVLYARTRF